MARLIASTELKDRMATQDVLLVDVGAPTLFEGSHLPGAINIPIDQLQTVAIEKKTQFLRRDIIIVYGEKEELSLSDEASAILEQCGFDRVGNFFGGRSAWFNAGYRLEQQP
ncbi:MAG: hypothetical protein AUK47_27975 [Deltaproteobacteria bacterium CG2_30_63_29]|nr:MAG: hypothetical protein AUK47_27975 [Deltaproteobacteria bacterium CG2_30_63_29]